jgi:hypothetical protein
MRQSQPRPALAALAALAFALAIPARAGREWYQHLGPNNWTQYNYLNYDRYASVGTDEWGTAVFSPGSPSMKYFLKYVDNFTSEGHCYEIEIGPPENSPADSKNVFVYFWDQAAGGWTDLLGLAGKGKGRLYLKNSEFQMFQAIWASTPQHAGYYLHRKNLGESDCTTGQASYNWLKIIDGVQSKGITAR